MMSLNKRLPFTVRLSVPWHRSAQGNFCARLQTPAGEYALCIFQIADGFNTVVSGPRNYKEFGIKIGETPLSYRQARADMIEFQTSMKRHYSEVGSYAAAA